jgi:hypothetical protein
MDRSYQVQVATLDDALRLIAKAGILISRLPEKGQQDLLRHMVKRVVINPEGEIRRMELQTPFCYLQKLANEAKGLKERQGPKTGSAMGKTKTSKKSSAGSTYVQLGDPGGTRTLNQLIKSQLLCQLSYGANDDRELY